MDNKRVISYLLAIIMLFGTLINPVFAISSNPNKGEEAKYEIQEIDGKLYKAYKISDLGLKNPEKLLTPKYRTRAAGDPMENWVKLLLQSNTVGLTFGDDFDIEVFVAIRRKKTKIAVAKINPTKEIVENEYFYFVKTDEYDENNPDHQNPDKWYLYVEDDFKYDIRLKYGESGNFGSETMTMTINQRAIPLYKAVWFTNNQQRPVVDAIYNDGDNIANNVKLNTTDFAENEYKSVSSEKMPFTVAQKEVIVKEENLGTVDKEKFLVSDMKGAALWKLEIEQDGVKKTKGTIEDGDTKYHFNITGDFKTPFVATMREELNVKFDPNGAKWVDAETDKEKEAKSYPIGHSMKLNESFGDLDKVTVPVAKDIKDIPEKDGVAQEFKGWTTEANKDKTYDELVAADKLIYPDDVKAEKFEKQITEKQAEIDGLKKKIEDNKATINQKLGHLKETEKLRKDNADFEKQIEEKSKELDKIKAYQIGYQTIEKDTTFYAVYAPKEQGKANVKFVYDNKGTETEVPKANLVNSKDEKYKDSVKDSLKKEIVAATYDQDGNETLPTDADKKYVAKRDLAPKFVGYEFVKVEIVKHESAEAGYNPQFAPTKDGEGNEITDSTKFDTIKYVYKKLDDIIPEKGDDGKPNPKVTEDVKKTYVKVLFNADDDKHTGKNQRGKLYLGDTEPADDKKVDQLVYYVNPKADPAKTLKNVIDENKVNVKANANYEVKKEGENVSWTFGLKAGKDEASLAEIKEHSISNTSQVIVNQTDNDGNDLLTEIILTANYVMDQGTVTYEFVSGTDGKTLPEGVTSQKPGDKEYDVQTEVTADSSKFNSVPVKENKEGKDVVVGSWTFKEWKVGETKTNKLSVTKAGPNKFTGVWEFTESGKEKVTYRFESKDKTKTLPKEVTDLLTKTSEDKFVGETVAKPADPETKTIEVKETINGTEVVTGKWTFASWSPDSLTVKEVKDQNKDKNEFVGTWNFTESDKGHLVYNFTSNDGTLPKEVTDLKPTDNKENYVGVKVTPDALSKTSVDGKNGEKEGIWSTTWTPADVTLAKGENKVDIAWTFAEKENAEISYKFNIAAGVVPDGYDVNNAPFNKDKANLTKDYVKTAYVDSTVNAPGKIKKTYDEVINTTVGGKPTTIRGTWTFVEWEPTNLKVNKDGNVFTGTWTFGEKLVRPADPNNPIDPNSEVEIKFLKGEHGTLSGIALVSGKEGNVTGRDELAYYVKKKATWAAMAAYIPTAVADSGWRVANPSWKPILPATDKVVEEATFTAQYVAKPTDRYITLTLDENYRNGKITDYEVLEGDLIENYLYIPRRRGYIFKGWSYDSRRLDEVRPGDRIYYPTTLYAIWTKQKAKDDEEVEPIDTRAVNEHKAYMFGYTDGSVRPNGSITRAEAAALVTRLLGIEANASSMKPAFTDTPSSWYNKAINAAVARGIMKGYPDGRFRPNAPITRAEFTQMIYTFDNKPYGVAPFADVVGHWAERAIGSEYQAKRITGYPDGLFRPDANITRAEAVVILNKIFERNYDAMSAINAMNKEKIKVFTDLHTSFWGFNDMVEATNTHLFKRRVKGAIQEDWVEVK